MSNILTPIVAKYSLFFTLTMCSSSSISRSKQPTHLVQTLLLEAQQRYQDKSTEKMRALVRHLSTTSTSSSSLSQSAASQLTSGSTEISSPSSFQPVVSSSSSSSSRIEPPSSSHLPLDKDIPSLPPVKEATKSSVVTRNKSSEHHHIKDNDSNTNTNNSNNNSNSNNKTKNATLVSTLDTKRQDHPNHNHSSSSYSNSNGDNNHNHNSSSPCLLSPLGEAATATAAVDATVSSDRQKQASTLPSPSPSISVSSASVATVHTKLHQQLQQQLTTTRRDQQGSSKVNKSSIAALLSVTLTMILLSLLQSKKRHIRRKGRSSRGTTSKRNSRGGRQLLQLHRDGYKSAGTDQFTHRSHSPSSSYTHLLLTDSNNNNMEGTSSEGARSLLTQYRPVSFFGGHGGEPTAALHIPQHGLVLSDNHNNSTLPPSNTLHYESTTPLPHQGNMYSGRDLGYSLSDCSLPDKRSKRDLVADWLDQQTFVAPEMTESLESLPLAQDGPNTYGHDNDPLQQFLPPQYYQQQQQHQQQQQQSTLPRQLGFPAQLDPNQLYLQQHSINNTGAQREPRQEHRRAIQRSNDLYPGSRTSLYHSHSTKRHSMVALDQQPQHQPNHRLSQPQLQQQQLSSSSSFWRDAPSQPQSQPQSQQQPPTPHQYRPPYPHYPQQHTPHPQQHNLPQYAYYQQQYQQPTSSPSFRPPIYDPYGYDDPDQQDPNHRRSLSLNNSGGRGGVRSRPQSQVYRKAAPARFENLSLAEQARQEHQMRRQHYQQHYHQHRQQQQHQHQHQQYQHQQYYQAPGSRPESMYSNGPAAPRAHTMGSTSPREASQFVPPRHHHQQSHPRPHPPPPQQQQQHHHNSELRHSSVSSPKGSNVSRSANDLAWERHCYYQQQQIQEDALAERKRIEQQLQHQRKAQRPVSSVEGLQVPLLEGSTSLMRTSSMSRISNSSTTAVAGGNASSSLRRRVDSATVAHQSPSSGLSRSVSTSAILEAKQRAANKDKVNSANLKKNKESPVDGTETKSTSVFDDCKFLRLLRRSDSKLDKAATAVGVTMTEANTESPSTSASSKKQSKVPAIATIQPVDSIPSPSPPPPAAATTGLNRRKTLKDLGPSIRSLARRCSSRFSNNSSRPNSFAGSSSDPVIQFSEGKGASGAALGGVRGSHSLSMATSYLPLKMSLSSLPRSLAPGPDGMVDLQQAAEPHVRQSTPSSGIPSSSLTDMPALAPLPSTPEKEQRVPIHRKVTLFRSKTMYLVKSSSSSSSRAKTTTPGTHTADTIDTTPSVSTANAVADDDNNANTKNSARANSFPSRRRPQRDSLRLANGHGLDFNNFLPPITVTTSFSTISAGTSSSSEATEDEQATAVERSTNDLESALPGRSTLVPIPAAIITSSRLSDADLQQKARRQIISLLAMGRKGRISAKTGQSMKSGSSSSSQPSTPTTASSPTTPISQLSPLALEAQEDLFVGGTAGGAKNEGEEDPVERIAFMLVPKSRYEFQPLVVA